MVLGITILAQIINFIKGLFLKKVNDKNVDDAIDQIFLDKKLLENFEEFANSEYSLVNIMIYIDLKEYEKLPVVDISKLQKPYDENNPTYINYLQNIQTRLDKINEIKIEYLNGEESVNELNVDSRTLKKFEEKLNQKDLELRNHCLVDNSIFKEIYNVVKFNLSDTFSRYQLTLFYVNHLNQKTNKEIIKTLDTFK
jgi:hypothetical protein